MMSAAGEVVLPGDVIASHLVEPFNCKVVIGPGLRKDDETVVAITCGVFRRKQQPKNGPIIVWVDTQQKRYVPRTGDPVIGVVSNRTSENFRVDIGAGRQANLSYLAFEGATKRNRPNVQVGDLVYARVLVANRDMEPDLVCIDSYGRKKDMGVLDEDGLMITTSLHVCKRLISPTCQMFFHIGKHFPFEVAVGMNGRVWVRAKSTLNTLAIANVIRLSEHMNNEEVRVMSEKMAEVLNWKQYWT